tara:strand:+ start:621 stop:845 length:225 start_codon:yes stop_codon:yes gene_type:complete
MAHNHNTGNPNRDAHRAGNVGDGNVGDGNVGVGTTSTSEKQTPAPPPPAPEPDPEPSGPIVSDDRDAADAGEVK